MPTAADIMTDSVHCVESGQSIARVKHLLLKHKIAKMPVLEGGRIVGIVSENDLVDALFQTRNPIDTILVNEVMRKDVTLAGPEDTPEKVASSLSGKTDTSVIVFDKDENQVMGIVTKTDLAKYFSENYHGKAKVSELMQKNVQSIQKFHSIFRAAKEMASHKIGRLVVLDPKLEGIVTARDIAFATYGLRPEKLVYERENKDGKPVRDIRFKPMIVADIMHEEVYTIPSKSDAASAVRLMLDKNIGSVVVVDNDEVKGIITKTDVVDYLANL